MTIAALVLAAGPSRRLGEPKQVLPWGGKTLLGHVVAQTLGWPVDAVWVVLGYRSDEIVEAVDLGGAGVVENPEWQEGMASSLRVGLDALGRTPAVEAAFVVMGDQPNVDVAVVRRLLLEHRDSRSKAIIPRYRYVRGNPVLIPRSLWPRVMSLEGDQGARRLLQAHPEWVQEVWFSQLPPRDVDTVDDVAALQPRNPA